MRWQPQGTFQLDETAERVTKARGGCSGAVPCWSAAAPTSDCTHLARPHLGRPGPAPWPPQPPLSPAPPAQEGCADLSEEDYQAADAERGAEQTEGVKDKVRSTVVSTMQPS